MASQSRARENIAEAVKLDELVHDIAGREEQSMRELFGKQDLKAKAFLKNLTRFHRLKQQLDQIAHAQFSEFFLEKYPAISPSSPLIQECSDLNELMADAQEAEGILKELIGEVVCAAGLSADCQPNYFIEISQGGDQLYTAATMGPLKKQVRVLEKSNNEYDGDHRRVIDIARASIVVDTEKELCAVFDRLLEGKPGKVQVLRFKNRFASPSFNGYRDSLWNLEFELSSGRKHITEIQVHLAAILEKKAEAHIYYDYFRSYFHGNMTACNHCMELLQGILGDESFSVRLLERVAKSTDVPKLQKLVRFFEHHCSQYTISLIFRRRIVQVEADAASVGFRGDRTIRLADALNNLGRLYMKMAMYKDADLCAKQAIAMSRSSLARPVECLGPEIARPLCTYGFSLRGQGRYQESEDALSESLALFEDAYGSGALNEDLAWVLLDLGILRKDQARYDEAEQFVNRSVEAFAAGGNEAKEPSPQVGVALTELGSIHMSVGKLAEAQECFVRAKGLLEKAVGAEHPDTARCMRKLGNTARMRGDLEFALSEIANCSKISEKVLGLDHPLTLCSLSDQVETCILSRKLDEAETLANKAQSAVVRLYDEQNFTLKLVREIAGLNGMIQSMRGNYSKAREWLKPAADAEKEQGLPPTWIAQLLLNEAREMRAAGKTNDEVEAKVQEAIAEQQKAHGTSDYIRQLMEHPMK